MNLVVRTDGAFRRAGIRHMIVGGVANQIHVARYLCDIYDKNLADLASQGILCDSLRYTDDLDVAVGMEHMQEENAGAERDVNHAGLEDAKKIMLVLDDIVGEGTFFSPTESHLVSIDIHKRGHGKSKFFLGLDGELHTDKEVTLKIYRGPECLRKLGLSDFDHKCYDFFLGRAVDVEMPYPKGESILLKVKKPEDQFITKMFMNRTQDLSDAFALVRNAKKAGKPINSEEVVQFLQKADQDIGPRAKYFIERYEAFRDLERTYEE